MYIEKEFDNIMESISKMKMEYYYSILTSKKSAIITRDKYE